MADTSNPVTDDQTSVTPPPPAQDDATAPVAPTSRRQKEVAPFSPSTPTESSAGATESTADSVEQSSSGAAEVEPARELEPEVEKMVEKIKNQEVKGPKETVISAEETPDSVPKTVAQPVVVLPLSEQGMKKGRSKNTKTSIRWLYEWCRRQIRKLSKFLVVYREE